jgi:nucleotide-binding universal stress UspA family protein
MTDHSFELGTDGPKVILVGVDGSDSSMRAAAYAWGLARRQRSRLVIVHAASAGGLSSTTPGGAALLQEATRQILDDIRQQVQQAAARDNVTYEIITGQGDAYTVISRTADTVRADAVVVGASTQAGHRFIGSVAVRLVKSGRWPVTVVP